MDTNTRDELVHRIGQTVISTPQIQQSKWDGVALVYAVDEDDSPSLFGYVYTSDDDWQVFERGEAFKQLLDDFDAFRDATQVEPLNRWKSCLFQVRSDAMEVSFDLEYDDADRWTVTPENLEQGVAEIRP